MTRTRAEYQAMLTGEAVGAYIETYNRIINFELEGGQVPGLQPLTKQQVLAIFRSLDEPTIEELAARDPAGMMKLAEEDMQDGSA